MVQFGALPAGRKEVPSRLAATCRATAYKVGRQRTDGGCGQDGLKLNFALVLFRYLSEPTLLRDDESLGVGGWVGGGWGTLLSGAVRTFLRFITYQRRWLDTMFTLP